MLNKGEDPSMQMEKADFENSDIVFTDDYEELKRPTFISSPFQPRSTSIKFLTSPSYCWPAVLSDA